MDRPKPEWTVADLFEEKPCHGWRAQSLRSGIGRSRAIFACPLTVGESHPENVEEVQYFLAETFFPFRCPRAHQSRDGAVLAKNQSAPN